MKSTAIRLFLGGAAEQDAFVRALAEKLRKWTIVQSWRTAFPPGESTLVSLRNAATVADFAVFVWGREDRTISRRKAKHSPRDNVVYEAGLFAGYLGPQRTFVVVAPDTKIPTDYLGVTTIPKTSIDSVAARIKDAIAHLGPVPTTTIVGDWWQLVTSGDMSSSIISFMQIAVQPDSRVISMQGTSWNRTGRLIATWHCPAAAFDERMMTLHYSWEGVHTRDESLPAYFGVGQISFRHEPFIGSFSSTPRSLSDRTVFRRARYVKAEPADAGIVHGLDVTRRRRLIQRRLQQRAVFAEG